MLDVAIIVSSVVLGSLWLSDRALKRRDARERWELEQPDRHEQAMHQALVAADERKYKAELATELEKAKAMHPPPPPLPGQELRTVLSGIRERIAVLAMNLDSMRVDVHVSPEKCRQANEELDKLRTSERAYIDKLSDLEERTRAST